MSGLNRRVVLRTGASAVAIPVSGTNRAGAESSAAWPMRPVRLVVPYAAGGPSDIIARAVQAPLQASLGQSVIVENRPGGGAIIGTEAVARESDGHTFLVADSPHTIIPAVQNRVPYDPSADFTPVSLLGGVTMLLMLNPAFPAQTLADLVAAAKAKPEAVTFGSSGVGSLTHLLPEWLSILTRTKFTTVPYRGSGPALLDVVAGQIDAIFSSTLSASGQLSERRVRPLAAAAPARLPALPDVPTFREQSLDLVSSNWWGLLAPRSTPPSVLARVETATRTALAEPAVVERFAALGIEARLPGPAPFADLLATEFENWARVANLAGVRVP